MAPGGLRSCRPRPTLSLAAGGEGPACELANLVIAVEPFAPINLCLETQRGRQTTAEGPWQKQEGQGPTCQPSASWGPPWPRPDSSRDREENRGWGLGGGAGLRPQGPAPLQHDSTGKPRPAVCPLPQPRPGDSDVLGLGRGQAFFFFFFFLYFFFFLNTPRSSSNAVSE